MTSVFARHISEVDYIMYVKDHMTRNPKTITKDMKVSTALDIMQKNDFHRLPVVDDSGKLIGLITEGLVAESTNSNATMLDIYELNYLLSRTLVKDLMITNVKTIHPDVLLEEAAAKMLENRVSVLPVTDDHEQVVGIITEKDIFQAFLDLMGYRHQGTRFVLECQDVPGEFADAARLFADADANLESCAVYHTDRGAEIVIKATGEIPVEEMTDILVKHGYKITNIIQTNNDGTTKHYPTK